MPSTCLPLSYTSNSRKPSLILKCIKMSTSTNIRVIKRTKKTNYTEKKEIIKTGNKKELIEPRPDVTVMWEKWKCAWSPIWKQSDPQIGSQSNSSKCNVYERKILWVTKDENKRQTEDILVPGKNDSWGKSMKWNQGQGWPFSVFVSLSQARVIWGEKSLLRNASLRLACSQICGAFFFFN